MSQDEFKSLEHCKLKRTKSVDNTAKINHSATCDFLTDDNSDLFQHKTGPPAKIIHRKDAINYDVCRTKSLNFGLNEIDAFIPMPGENWLIFRHN